MASRLFQKNIIPSAKSDGFFLSNFLLYIMLSTADMDSLRLSMEAVLLWLMIAREQGMIHHIKCYLIGLLGLVHDSTTCMHWSCL